MTQATKILDKVCIMQKYNDSNAVLECREDFKKAEAYITKAVNCHDELISAVNKAIGITLDSVVGQAIKDGTLLPEEQHAGLCLLGYIRRKALKQFEQALTRAKEV